MYLCIVLYSETSVIRVHREIVALFRKQKTIMVVSLLTSGLGCASARAASVCDVEQRRARTRPTENAERGAGNVDVVHATIKTRPTQAHKNPPMLAMVSLPGQAVMGQD